MERSYSPPAAERLAQAWALFKAGEKRQAEDLCRTLLADGYQPAHLLEGLICEFGGDGIEVNLTEAERHYRQIAYQIRSPVGFVYLARVSMKQGGDRSFDVLRYLEEAKSIRMTPEVDLAYAKYYESGSDPDYGKARLYYRHAALAGRFEGFFGYSAMSRKLGQNGRAWFVDGLRLVAGPFLFLLLGKQTRKTF